MAGLIQGFHSLEFLLKAVLHLLERTNNLKTIINDELSFTHDNVEYLRLLQILHARLLNDPLSAIKIESIIRESISKERFLDANTVNSMNILKGSYFSSNSVH